MRLLFDKNTPFSLTRDLVGHESNSVIRLGWRGTKNGLLLTKAERAGFQVLITYDDDMKPEQNMKTRQIAILVLKPAKQGKAALKRLVPSILSALETIQPGEIRVISAQE